MNSFNNLGVDFYSKKLKTKNEIFSLQIWDTNGSEIERQFLNLQMYKNCSLFIIVCSLDNLESFENIENWLDHITNVSKNLNKTISHLVPIVLLINKNDLKQEKPFKIADVYQKIKNLRFSIWPLCFSCKENNYKEVLDKIDSLVKDDAEKFLIKKDKLQINAISSDEASNSEFHNNSTKRTSFKIRKNSDFNDRDKKSQKSCC